MNHAGIIWIPLIVTDMKDVIWTSMKTGMIEDLKILADLIIDS